jgi:glycosyltransferase involved in cell wall biosynthesis
LLPKAIASLTAQTLAQEDYEIIVVDNSPDHANAEAMGQRYRDIPNLRWLVEKTPGLSNARNVATQHARAPVIAFMDDDAIAASAWLESLTRVFEDFGDAVHIVGGRIDPIWGAPQPAWLPDSLLGYVSVVNWGGVARLTSGGEWVAGTNIAFRVEALKAAGGFPVHLGRTESGKVLLSNDETEVIARMGAISGHRLAYAPDAAVEHLVPAERLSQPWFRRRVAWQAVSDYILDPARFFETAPDLWNGVTNYYAHIAPKYRSPRGLYMHHRDPVMFEMQMTALYNFSIALLAGFRGLDES